MLQDGEILHQELTEARGRPYSRDIGTLTNAGKVDMERRKIEGSGTSARARREKPSWRSSFQKFLELVQVTKTINIDIHFRSPTATAPSLRHIAIAPNSIW